MFTTSNVLLVVAAIVGGALISAQGPIYARMSLALGGPITAALVAFVIATIAIGSVALFTGAVLPTVDQIKSAPSWIWLGALVGVYQVLVSIVAVPKIGVGAFVLLVVFGQIIASQFYDHFGWFGLDIRRIELRAIIGMALMASGLVIVFWR